MILLVLLPSCGWVPPDALLSGDDATQAQALEDLTAWQARQIVPLLGQIANDADDYDVYQNVYGALVRADTPAAEAVLRDHLVRTPTTRFHILRALGRHHTRRSCDLMAEVWLASPPGDEQELLEFNLSSTSLDDGWPCFQSLGPHRASDPRADALWRRVAPTL